MFFQVTECVCVILSSRESGTKDVPFTVPDTITTWETEAFCLSPQGFGLAPRKEIKVFQPFFLELSLPYSIIRGEHFELKATTFNYLSTCIMVINAFISASNCWNKTLFHILLSFLPAYSLPPISLLFCFLIKRPFKCRNQILCINMLMSAREHDNTNVLTILMFTILAQLNHDSMLW